jgi:large conductance mechanosensitive channel
MLKEFKAFALKGNVIDLAVGVIIGGAFGKIVSSLVNDILMPVIGVILGGVSFIDLKYVITPASGDIAELARATMR